MFCTEIIKTTWIIFSSDTPSLLYYSHLPTALVSLFIGFFVYFSDRKSLVNRIFLGLNVLYSMLAFLNIVLWTNSNLSVVTVIWVVTQILFVAVPLFALYFFNAFITKKDIGLFYKILWSLSLVIVSFITASKLNVLSFNIDACEPNIGNTVFFVQNIIFAFIFLTLIIQLFRKIIISRLPGYSRKELLLFFGGIFIFILFFTVAWQFAENYDYFIIEQYGLFGMTVLLAVISFIIVRFKAFDIKLIGSQALVWALIILIGSEFFFVETFVNQVLVAITLVLSAIVGLMIIRSVKKEIAQKEELAIANENQQLLIRFITHQVKGFFTKSKMVFASILEGDVGEVSEPVKNLMKDGLESDNKAVEMVQEVLKASSLRSGTMTYNFEKINLAEFIGGIGETFRDTAVAKNLQYEINLPAEAAEANIDKLQMTQVIKNLIDNSVKYTLTGFVHVNLKIKTIKDRKNTIKSALFSVEDSGVGLSDGDKAKLFKEGGRGEESLKVNVNSTGYGLFIVKKIVEGHKGSIWAESRGRGHGTKFFVEIPLVNSSLK